MKITVADLLKEKGGNVYAVDPDSTVYQVIEEMDNKKVGALLVMRSGKVEGIISERDYARKIILKGKSSKATLVKEIMTCNPFYASPEQSVTECLELMTEKRIRHLPVSNDDELLGMISIGDLVSGVIKEQKFHIDQLHQYINQ
ncbi:MAG: CBS domain-containing protein [Francisellaceae bacterium]|jgi:CBS domain-containing protein